MKALYFTIAMLSILAATAVNAQNYEQDYDVVNKENLRNQAGFATLRGGNEITADVMSYDNQNLGTSMNAPQAEMTMAQPAQIPSTPQQPTTAAPAQPSIAMQPAVTTPQQPAIVETSTPAPQAMPVQQAVTAEAEIMDPTQFNEMQPAAGTVIETNTMASQAPSMAAPTAQPDVVMVDDNSAQTVFTKKTIIGNTDTGVNPETVLKALEGQNLN